MTLGRVVMSLFTDDNQTAAQELKSDYGMNARRVKLCY